MRSYEKIKGTRLEANLVRSLTEWAKTSSRWTYKVLTDAAHGDNLRTFNSKRVIKEIEENAASMAANILNNYSGSFQVWLNGLSDEMKQAFVLYLPKFYDELKRFN